MKVTFTATIQQFEKHADKTGWSYIEIPADIAQKLKPGNKKSFRVKGKLDNYAISHVSLLPMGDGNFILPINAAMRKGTGKRKGASLRVQLEAETQPTPLSADLLECLADEPEAMAFFKTLTPSHQRYFSTWIDSAKTEQTKAKRIAQSITALCKGMGYVEMVRALKRERDELSGR
jgi:hypothetical protein